MKHNDHANGQDRDMPPPRPADASGQAGFNQAQSQPAARESAAVPKQSAHADAAQLTDGMGSAESASGNARAAMPKQSAHTSRDDQPPNQPAAQEGAALAQHAESADAAQHAPDMGKPQAAARPRMMRRQRYRLRVNWSALPLKGFSPRKAAHRLKLSLLDGWYSPGDRSSQDRARLLVLNYTANIIANLIGGSFFTGLLLLMDADDGFIGTMSMIGVAANMVQMFAPLLLERFKKRKPLLLAMRASTMVINILVIGLIPLAPIGKQAQLTLVGVCVAVVNFVGALAAPGITVWHLQSIPPRVRSGFFSLVTMTVGSVVAIFNLLGSTVVDAFTAHGNEYGGLMALRIFAFALYVVDFYLYMRIKEYPYEDSGERFKLRDLFTLPLKNRIYLRTIAIVFLWNVTANIPGSYYTVYLLKNLNVSYTYIMIMNMLNVPVVLLLTRVWSRISSGRSPFKVLSMGMSMYLLHYIGLAFVGQNTLFIYPITLIWAFVMAIGINLPFASIPYVNIPRERQTVFIGFYSTMANFAALIGVAIGKYFIAATEELKISIFGFEMINKQYLLLLTAALMAIATLLVHRIDKVTPCEDS